jgi:hypothetical protein
VSSGKKFSGTRANVLDWSWYVGGYWLLKQTNMHPGDSACPSPINSCWVVGRMTVICRRTRLDRVVALCAYLCRKGRQKYARRDDVQFYKLTSIVDHNMNLIDCCESFVYEANTSYKRTTTCVIQVREFVQLPAKI